MQCGHLDSLTLTKTLSSLFSARGALPSCYPFKGPMITTPLSWALPQGACHPAPEGRGGEGSWNLRELVQLCPERGTAFPSVAAGAGWTAPSRLCPRGRSPLPSCPARWVLTPAPGWAPYTSQASVSRADIQVGTACSCLSQPPTFEIKDLVVLGLPWWASG